MIDLKPIISNIFTIKEAKINTKTEPVTDIVKIENNSKPIIQKNEVVSKNPKIINAHYLY